MLEFYISCTADVTVGWTSTSYSVNEDWASVDLILSKDEYTPCDATVSLTIIAGTAQGVCSLIQNCFSVSNSLMITAPQDYFLSTSNVTFSSWQNIQIVSLSIVNDTILENVENFFVMITGHDGVEGGQNASIFIYDDDCEQENFKPKP